MKGFTLVQNSKSKFGDASPSDTACSIGLRGTRWSRENKPLRYPHQHPLTTEGNTRGHPAPIQYSLGRFGISCLAYRWELFECLLTTWQPLRSKQNIKLRYRWLHQGLIDKFAHTLSFFFLTISSLPSILRSNINFSVKLCLMLFLSTQKK